MTPPEIHRAELVGDAVRAGAHLASGGAVEPLEWRPGTQAVDDFAALIGRAEHDGSTKTRNGVFAEVLAQQNAPMEWVTKWMLPSSGHCAKAAGRVCAARV